MRSARVARQIASAFVLVIRIILINTTGQTPLVTTLSSECDESNHKTTTNDSDASRLPSPALSATPSEEPKDSSPVTLAPPEPKALTSRDPRKLGPLDRAYLDAFTILNNDNPCSRLFGGQPAITVLTEFVQQLKPHYLDRNIAIRMSGQTTTFQSHATGLSFRLFERAEINPASSFFRNNEHASITNIFRPNTRETRVVVLLHELGHLIKTPEHRWVLPDDGNDPSLSLENTVKVVSICRQQIDAISQMTAAQELETAAAQGQKTPQ